MLIRRTLSAPPARTRTVIIGSPFSFREPTWCARPPRLRADSSPRFSRADSRSPRRLKHRIRSSSWRHSISTALLGHRNRALTRFKAEKRAREKIPRALSHVDDMTPDPPTRVLCCSQLGQQYKTLPERESAEKQDYLLVRSVPNINAYPTHGRAH